LYFVLRVKIRICADERLSADYHRPSLKLARSVKNARHAGIEKFYIDKPSFPEQALV
jgi:hypothetical protein